MSVDTLLYIPTEMWVPVAVSADLETASERYAASPKNIQKEAVFVQEVATAAEEIIPCYDPNIYRADKASELQEGNCFAKAEVITGILKALNHDSSIMWDGHHASVLWQGRARIWHLDEMGAQLFGNHNFSQNGKHMSQYQKAARQIMAGTTGRAFMTEDDSSPEHIQWEPLVDPINKAGSRYNNPTLILPADEGIRMLGAYGDAKRYKQLKPETWEAISEQILEFIPVHAKVKI